MNKKLFLSLAAAGATLLSCSDAVVETTGYNSPIETKANLTVKAEDARTGAMLSAANGLQMIFPDRVGNQLASGAFVFEDVYVGLYNVIVSATGYATVNATVGIGAPEQQDNVHIAYENTFIVPIYPLIASLEGYVYYPNKEGVNIPAKDVAVQLHFTGANCVLHKRVYDADSLTDKDGKYTIDSLPAIGPNTNGCNYTLYALGGTTGNMPFQTAELNTGIDTECYQRCRYECVEWDGDYCDRYENVCREECQNIPPPTFNLSSGTTSNSAGIRVISNNTSVFVVSNYTEVVADTLRGSSITFTFSDKIDKQTVNLGTISYGTEIAEVTWTDNSVTLKPASRWSNDFKVSFSGLKSVTGKYLDQKDYLVIVHKPNISKDTVTNLKINNWLEEFGIIGASAIANQGRQDSVADFNSSFWLSWTPVKGAEDGYDIFVKYENESNYKKVGSVGEKDSVADVSITGGPIKNQKLRFLVQAKNSQYKSVLDDKKALPVFDNCSPIKRTNYDTTIVPKPVIEEGGVFVESKALPAGSLGISTVSKIHKLVFTFDEDMNINTKRLAADSLTLSLITNNGLGKDLALTKLNPNPTYEWTGEKELTVYVTVVPSAAAAPIDLDAKFTIAGLKDKSGNPFLSEFNEINSTSDVTGLYTNIKWKEGLVVRITASL